MSEQKPIRVVVVDDHAMVRFSLTMSLQATDDITVVGEASDGEEALRVCEEVHPTVVLLDLRLPRLDGLATIRALQRQDPVPRILVLTASFDGDLIPEALAAGASGYLMKLAGMDELTAAIRAVQAGTKQSE